MKQKGFTLVELLSTLAVIVILSGAAWPSFLNLKLQLQADAVQHEWLHFLNLARSSAVTHEKTITVCPIFQGECSANLNGEWTIFTDENKNKTVDDGEFIIQTLNPPAVHRYTLYPQNRNFLRFYNEPTGVYSGLMSSITICPTGRPDKYASHLRINVMGRISATQERNESGVPLNKRNGKMKKIKC